MARFRRRSRGPRATAAVLAVLAVNACSGPAVFVRRPDQPITWPPEADSARVAFVLAYGGGDDVERHPGFWASLGELLSGAEPKSLLAPSGLSLQPPSRLWVADPGLAVVHRIDLVTGEHTTSAGSRAEPMATPVGVAVGDDGAVFVSDSTRGRILVLDGDGTVARAFGTLAETGRPTGIAWDAHGRRLLVLDTTGCRLLAYAPDGRLLQQVGARGASPGQFNYPTNVAVGPGGRVYVMDSLNFRVQILAPDLAPVAQFGVVGRGPGCFAVPKGIAVDSDGHVYVVDSMFENVQIFDDAGQLLLAFGGPGAGLGDLALPSGIWIDRDDRIYVADSAHSRVQIYQYLKR